MNKQAWDPGSLLAVSGYYWKTCTLHAAVRLGVFTLIGNEKKKAEEIAKNLAIPENGLTRLLDALVAMGLLAKEKEGQKRYANTDASLRFLVKDSPDYLGYIIMHHHYLVDSWARLHESILTGRPVRKSAARDSDERLESFLMGMFNIASLIAPAIVKQVDLSGRRHLVDLGGGPGTYAINFCMQTPGLKATVYDLPESRRFAEKIINRFGMARRVDFKSADYLKDDIDGRYDVAWLSHILHAEGPEDCIRIIKKVVSVIDPGGLIIIHEFILEDTMDAPLFPALFSLNMFLGTESGRSYSEGQLRDMLAQSGVRDIKRLPFRSPTDSGLITGVV